MSVRRILVEPFRILSAALALGAMAGGGVCARAQSPIDIVHVNGPIYALIGAGGNVTASVGRDGVLLVDAGEERMSDALLAAIDSLRERAAEASKPEPKDWGAEGHSTVLDIRNPPPPPKPIRYIINTSAEPKRTGGNAKLSQSGRTYTGGNVAGTIGDAGEGAAIWAHEDVLFRLVEEGAPFEQLPTDTYVGDGAKLGHFVNGNGVRLIHVPRAQSAGATMVYFTRADVLVTGGFFSQAGYPVIDVAHGGSIDGVIDALNLVLDIAVPEFRTEGGTMIVPGDGRVSDSADVGYYRDMLTIIRNNIQEMINRGMSLAQIKAERPTKAYDARFGSDSGDWTTDMFVEAVYQSLIEGR